MTLSVRPATMADIAAIDNLLQRTYPRLLKLDYPPSVLVSALPRMTRAQPQLIASGTYYVAEDEAGVLLGAGGWTANIPGQGAVQETGRANVRHVVTDDRALRRGVGRTLMSHSFATAREAGARWMHCMATRTAVPFYTALGFETLRDIDVAMGLGVNFPAVEMRRDL